MAPALATWIPWATKLQLPETCYYGAWPWGPPNKVEQHYTAGCGTPEGVRAVLADRGVSAHTCTGRTPYGPYPKMTVVGQYVPLDHAAAHSFEMAFRSYGNENAALPGDCDITEEQGEALAWVTAYEIAYARQALGSTIPVTRSPGCPDKVGLKCHADGFALDGHTCPWNPNGHTDTPFKATGDYVGRVFNASERAAADRSPWTWDRHMARVKELVPKVAAGVHPGEEELFMASLSDAQQQEVLTAARRQNDYLDGVQAAAEGKGTAGTKSSGLRKAGFRLHHPLFPDTRTADRK